MEGGRARRAAGPIQLLMSRCEPGAPGDTRDERTYLAQCSKCATTYTEQMLHKFAETYYNRLEHALLVGSVDGGVICVIVAYDQFIQFYRLNSTIIPFTESHFPLIIRIMFIILQNGSLIYYLCTIVIFLYYFNPSVFNCPSCPFILSLTPFTQPGLLCLCYPTV